ncbi:unknown protein [Microcystis aeruginosa NIES-843]|uniref:Uncharacterized protein n=1 Tax=Microcystis aeruginosa (strain NIES-843 / IAM M-2473) TaxID=449447 RepID=B0JX74_MICAN|nr:unknown protein [Microcystis aeruginosa NIES-843]
MWLFSRNRCKILRESSFKTLRLHRPASCRGEAFGQSPIGETVDFLTECFARTFCRKP